MLPNNNLSKTKTRYIIQPSLKSGVNIKTINGESILGAGNLEVSGGGGGSQEEIDAIKLRLDAIELDLYGVAEDLEEIIGEE